MLLRETVLRRGPTPGSVWRLPIPWAEPPVGMHRGASAKLDKAVGVAIRPPHQASKVRLSVAGSACLRM